MKFSFEHHLPTEPERVVAALTDQRFWELLATESLSVLPELLEIRTESDHTLTVVRFKLLDDLPREAARFIDPDAVTWVQETRWNVRAASADLRFIPDQAKALLSASAAISLRSNSTGTQRHIDGDLRIKIPLLGAKIETPLVGHIERYVDDETVILERFLETAHPRDP